MLKTIAKPPVVKDHGGWSGESTVQVGSDPSGIELKVTCTYRSPEVKMNKAINKR